jgi:molecular chaperone GrpE (heat shock protein)
VIIEEVQRGYDWKGQLLRRPKVNVAATHVEG